MPADPRSESRRFEMGDVIRYLPKGGSHCRQGTAIVHGNGSAVDTFWGIDRPSEGHWLRPEEIADAELVFALGEFRKLGEHYEDKEQEWLKYAPADRQWIGSQHQWQSTYYVRIGAEPDLETQISNAQVAIEEAERAARFAARTVQWRKEELAKPQAQRDAGAVHV